MLSAYVPVRQLVSCTVRLGNSDSPIQKFQRHNLRDPTIHRHWSTRGYSPAEQPQYVPPCYLFNTKEKQMSDAPTLVFLGNVESLAPTRLKLTDDRDERLRDVSYY